ncbi:MAG: hypothetical protein ACRCX2_32715 [Paraclostridium sp.]
MAKDKILKPFLGIISPENKFTVDTIDDLKSRNYLTLGDIVYLNGYYTAGDGAHHERKIEGADDGSGVQLANGLWANIVHSSEVNVSWFGAKGDRMIDDAIPVQKAIDYLKNERGIVILDKTFLEFKTGITTYGNICIHGKNTMILCDEIKSEDIAIRVLGSENSNIGGVEVHYAGTKTPALRDFTIFKSKENRKTGIGLATADDTSLPSYVGLFENFQVLGFETALSFRSRAYLLRFIKCAFSATRCVHVYGGGDSGENITFVDCTFFNSTLIFDMSLNVYYAFFCRGCSIDYSGKLVDLTNGFLSLDNCWIEGVGNDVNSAIENPSTINSQGTLKIINSDFRGRASYGPPRWSQKYYFKVKDGGAKANFIFKDNYVHMNAYEFLINSEKGMTYEISGTKSHQNSGTHKFASNYNVGGFDMWRDTYIEFYKDSHTASDGTNTKMTIEKIDNIITGAKDKYCYRILTPEGASEMGLHFSHSFKGKSSMRIKYKIVNNNESRVSYVWPTLRNKGGYLDMNVVGISAEPGEVKEGEYVIFKRDGFGESEAREFNVDWDGWLNFNLFGHYGDVELYISDIVCESW